MVCKYSMFPGEDGQIYKIIGISIVNKAHPLTLGILKRVESLLWQYLKYWRNEVHFCSVMVTFGNLDCTADTSLAFADRYFHE